MVGIMYPAFSASSLHRCSSFNNDTLVDRELLQWLALDARHDAGNEPARQTHLDDGDQRAVRFEGGEASAQVIQLLAMRRAGLLHR